VLQLVIAYAIINAMVCVNLSTAINRYHNRFAWVLIFGAIYAAYQIFEKRKELFHKEEA
jgi:hypothetical protein